MEPTRPSTRRLSDDGYVVLRSFVDIAALHAEFDRTMRDAFTTAHRQRGSTGNEFRYVPVMCARTPVSVSLVTMTTCDTAEHRLRRAVF